MTLTVMEIVPTAVQAITTVMLLKITPGIVNIVVTDTVVNSDVRHGSNSANVPKENT